MKISLVKLTIIVFFACELIYPILSFITTAAFASIICNLLVLFFLFLTLFSNIKNFKLFPWTLALLSVIFFVTTSFIYPEYDTKMYIEYNIWKMIFEPRKGIVLMLILTIANDPDDIFKALKISAIPVWAAYTIRSILGIGLSEVSGSNHAYGYAFLFVSIVYTISFLKEKKIAYLFIALISLVQIVMYASRTAILSYVVFLALYVLFYNNDKKFLGKKSALVILGVILAFVITSEFFLNFFASLMEYLGFSSRIIDSFIEGNFDLDGGRKRTYNLAASLLKEHPFGLGGYWDRYYCEYVYVHNFIYEILLDFGWIFGGIILISLLKNTIMILRSADKSWKILFMLFFSLSMVRLMLSYSFWYDTNFWAMIAVIIGYRYHIRKNKLKLTQNALKGL